MEPKMFNELKCYLLEGKFPPNCDKYARFTIKRRAGNFAIVDDDLYYIKGKGTFKETQCKVLSSAAEADNVFRSLHCSEVGAHLGQLKTRDAISQRYYWPGMSEDIQKWVSQCTVCQQNKATIKLEADYQPIKVKVPFQLIGMDLIGKLVKTQKGNQYICVIIDYCTRWANAYPIPTKSAVDVTKCILKFIYQFDVPKRILTDQGREFVNNINREVCKVFGIKRSLCAPYHPQTNGLVERLNGTIQRTLSKYVRDKPDTWDEYLDPIMFGLRTKKQLTTQFSPFRLMFGREASYPCDIPEHYQVDSSFEMFFEKEEVCFDTHRHDIIMNLVEENVEKSHQKVKQRRSKKNKLIIKVGDMVWRRNVRNEQRKGGKLDPDFLGLFTVVKIQDKSVDLVDPNGTLVQKVSIDHLKLHLQEKDRIPHKLCREADSVPPPPAKVVTPPPADSVPPPPAKVVTPPPADSVPHPTADVPPPPAKVVTPPPADSVPHPPADVPPPPAKVVTPPPADSVPHPPADVPPPSTNAVTPPPADVPPPPAKVVTPPPADSVPHPPADVPPPSTNAVTPPPADVPPPPAKVVTPPPADSVPHPPADVPPPSTNAVTPPPADVPPPPADSVPHAPADVPPPPSDAVTPPPADVPPPPADAVPPPPAVAVPSFYENCLKDAWGGKKVHVLLSKMGPYKQFYWDIARTSPNTELESEVINAYIANVVKKKTNSAGKRKALHIDTYEWTRIWEGKSSRFKCDPHQYDCILGAVHEPGHWILAAIFPSERRSIVVDPMGNDSLKIKQCLSSTRAFMRKRGIAVSRWTAGTVPHSLQKDCTSCGVFVLKYAEGLLAEESLLFANDKAAVSLYRRQIALSLMMESDDLSELCHHCGEKATGGDEEHKQKKKCRGKKSTAWTQCNICDRWYHGTCVSNPDPSKAYVCAAC